MPAVPGCRWNRNANVAEQVLPGDAGPPELELLGLGVHPWDAFLESPAGADITVGLWHAPEFTLTQRLPQHGNVSISGVFHTPRLRNTLAISCSMLGEGVAINTDAKSGYPLRTVRETGPRWDSPHPTSRSR